MAKQAARRKRPRRPPARLRVTQYGVLGGIELRLAQSFGNGHRSLFKLGRKTVVLFELVVLVFGLPGGTATGPRSLQQ